MKALKIKLLPHANESFLPQYATKGSAGLDLCAAIENDIIIKPGDRALVSTGISLEMEPGYEAQIRPRSGLALKNGITVLNTPGTIDSDYRGEIGVILINLGQESFTVSRGMRIAQMIIAKHEYLPIEQVTDISETTRGEGGFGSTGVKDINTKNG